jgi:carbon storage regulator
MLVLTRKLGEAIRIGDNVELYVVGVSRGKVKLGFKAPRNVAVQRAEIPERDCMSIGPAAPIATIVPMVARAELAGSAPLAAFRNSSGA